MAEDCYSDFSDNLKHALANSGRDLFRKGHYEQCVSSDRFKYSLVEFGLNKVDVGSYIGLCVPKSCADSEITKAVTALLDELHQPLKVVLIDSQTKNFSYQTSWMTYFAIALIIIVLAMVVWATCVQQTPKIVKAFDFRRNLEHFNIRQNSDLNIFDGIRAVCTLWMIFSHCFSFSFAVGSANMKTIHDRVNKPIYSILEEGFISVDVFFMMSGFLLAYIFLKKRQTSLMAYPVAVLQRVLRIWPAFFFAITYFGFVFIHTSKGPLWSQINAYVSNCSSFWESLLFFGNLIHEGDKVCMAWSWYLQVDIQIFIVCMVVLYLFSKSRPLAYLVMVFMMIVSAVFLFITSEENGFQIYWNETNFAEMMRFTHGAYMKPWSRSSSYFFGLIFGLKFYEYKNGNSQNHSDNNLLQAIKNRFTSSKMQRSLCQLFGFIILLAVLLCPQLIQQGFTFSQEFYSSFHALSRPIFIFGTILLILPTILGFGQTSFVNFLLTLKIFHFISKISFCTYLIHLMVVYQFLYTNSYDYYLVFITVLVTYLGILVISLFFGFCLTMCVEVPFANLQKMMFDSFKRSKEEKQEQNSLLEVHDQTLSPDFTTIQEK